MLSSGRSSLVRMRSAKREPVAQRGAMGCGVAAVAAILGCSYRAARRRFDDPERDKVRGFGLVHLARALAVGGLPYRRRRFRTKSTAARLREVGDGGVILIKCYPDDPCGHYLVRDRDTWLDSLGCKVTLSFHKKWERVTWKTPSAGRRWKRLPLRYQIEGSFFLAAQPDE
jgi:hypothetical protein